MRLYDWVESDDRSRKEMADFVGVHIITFHRWVSGKGMPAKRYAPKIRELTGGAVTMADLYAAYEKEHANG